MRSREEKTIQDIGRIMLKILSIVVFLIFSLTLAQILSAQPSYWYADKISFSLGCENAPKKTARLFLYLTSENDGATFYGRGTFQLTDFGTHDVSLTGSVSKGKFSGYFRSNFSLINSSKFSGMITSQNLTGVFSGKVICGLGKTATYANRIQLLRTKATQMPSAQSTLSINRAYRQVFKGEIQKVKFIEGKLYFSSYIGDLVTKTSIRVLNLENKQSSLVIEQPNPIDIITDFDSNGERFAVSAYSGISFYNVKENFKYITEATGNSAGFIATRVNSVSFNAAGTLFIADVGSYAVFSSQDFSLVKNLSKNSLAGTLFAGFLTDGKYVFADTFGILRVVDTQDPSKSLELNAKGTSDQRLMFIEAASMSRDKKYFVVGTGNPVVYNFTSKKSVQLTGSSSAAQSIDISPNNKYVAAAYKGGGCIIWDIVSGKRIWRSPTSSARSVAFSSDGKYLAISSDATIELYEAPVGGF